MVILSELKEGNSNERIIIQTYNYNLETNQMVNVNDIIKQKNINTANANNKIKNEICFCIGETTAEALEKNKIKNIIVASQPSIEDVIEEVLLEFAP